MRNYKLAILATGIFMSLLSCKKNEDFAKPEAPAEAANAISQQSGWTQVANWSEQKEQEHLFYSSVIADSSLTTSVTGAGLVLVYKKTGDAIHQLPFEDRSGNKHYFWFYQVSDGKILVAAEDLNTGAGIALTEQSFQYFVLTAEKIAALKEKGYSKEALIQFTYENIVKVLNQ